MSGHSPPRVSAVLLGYGPEPYLVSAVRAVLASDLVDVDVCVVDNGAAPEVIKEITALGAHVLRPAENLGFTGGCNLGVQATTGPLVALVNSDAIVHRGALAALAAVASSPDIGIASASIRLADDPDRMNSAGNPVHFLGLSWAGGLGDRADAHSELTDIASASGACLMLRREVWEALGGFPEEYFAYLEDAELSLRCWQRGLRVVFVPDARVAHHYEFSRNPRKLYLLERNRAILVRTLWSRRARLLLAPPRLAVEVGMLALATRDGWAREKVAGWRWTWAHRAWIRRRRAVVRTAATIPDAAFASLLADRIDQRALKAPPGFDVIDRLLAAYWHLVRRLL